MMEQMPIHDLCARLEARRLQAIQELAVKRGTPPGAELHEIATLQAVLTAVREEIASHEAKLGSGDESPLK